LIGREEGESDQDCGESAGGRLFHPSLLELMGWKARIVTRGRAPVNETNRAI